MKAGKVLLVGAGPGDLALLTEGAAACIRQADAIVYDALACPSILNRAKLDCRLIDVGKQAGAHTMPQMKINQLLVELAEEGLLVVRLKGGDPFVFGRGGEEATFLAEQGIEFAVIPGVSSCYSVPAYAGIPVTHREFASSFHVITGHRQKNGEAELDYETLAKLEGTLVFLMSRNTLPHIAQQLLQHGMAPETPTAVIQQGTTARQNTVTAPLTEIAATADRKEIGTPAMTVIGSAVQLRSQLAWLPRKPLSRKRVIATGTPAHVQKLAERLRKDGAETIELSLIHAIPLEPSPLPKIPWESYTWVVLTSSNGVKLLFEGLRQQKIDLRRLWKLKFAVMGNGTAAALAEQGIQADCIPEHFESRFLAQALLRQLTEKDRVLLLRAENGSPVLQMELQRAGVQVDAVPFYRTQPDLRKGQLLETALQQAEYLVFSSASAVRAFQRLRDGLAVPSGVRIISIGSMTTKTAEKLGIPVTATAAQSDIEGIAACILADAAKSEKETNPCIP